ncbi:MAG: hypothetical protein ACTJGR_01535 [Pauljensenia sp.]
MHAPSVHLPVRGTLLRAVVALVGAAGLISVTVAAAPVPGIALAASTAPSVPGLAASAASPAGVSSGATSSTGVLPTEVPSALTSPGCLLREQGWGDPVREPASSVLLPVVAAGDHTFTDSGGVTSSYHVSSTGVDFGCPWGIMFWFEGDQNGHPTTSITDSERLEDLARVAARANMVLVVPDTPDRSDPLHATWWKDYEGNGTWFRSLATTLVNSWGADPTDLWFTGYSGGAEFITSELLAADQEWTGGGGAVMIGGGETSGLRDEPSQSLRAMPLTWYVGSDDGEVDSEEWSPMDVAPDARDSYSAAGFSDVRLEILPGLGHTDYDVAALVTRALKDAGRLR